MALRRQGVFLFKQFRFRPLFRRLFPVLAAVAASHLALAPALAGEMSCELDDMVIRAGREELGESDLSLLPGFARAVELRDFDARRLAVEDVLQKEAAVQVRRSGGEGGFASASIRGASPSQVSVYLDRIPLNPASGGAADLSGVSLAELDSIEVFRGSTPAAFGASPIGGTVNLVTRKSGEKTGRIRLGAGSFGSFDASCLASSAKGRTDWLVSFDKLLSEGDYECVDNRLTPDDPSDDVLRVRRNNDVDRDSVLFKLGRAFGGGRRLDLLLSALDKDQGLPGPAHQQAENVRYGMRRHISQLKATLPAQAAARHAFSLRLYHAWTRERYQDFLGPSGEMGLGRQDSRNVGQELGAELLWQRALTAQQLEAKYEILGERYSPRDLYLDLYFPESRRLSHFLTLQDSFLALDERLVITPAIKFQRGENELMQDQWMTPTPIGGREFDDLTWQAGLKYSPRPWLRLRANTGVYSRQPAFAELFGDRGVTAGANDLVPEEGRNTDAGAEFCLPGRRAAFVRDFSLSAARFVGRRKNLIQYVFDARGVGRAVNIARADSDGWEFFQGCGLGPKLRLSQSLTLIDAVVRDSAFRQDLGRRVPGVFEKTYTCRLEWSLRGRARLDGFSVFAEALVQEGMFYDKSNLLRAADRNTVDAGLSWSRRRWLLSFEARNLGDERMEDFAGWPLPGRNLHFSAQYGI